MGAGRVIGNYSRRNAKLASYREIQPLRTLARFSIRLVDPTELLNDILAECNSTRNIHT